MRIYIVKNVNARERNKSGKCASESLNGMAVI